MNNFNYTNTEVKQHGGTKTVRNVTIKRGKGNKSVTTYKGRKRIYTIKKKLKQRDVSRIKKGKFIPGLFADCVKN